MDVARGTALHAFMLSCLICGATPNQMADRHGGSDLNNLQAHLMGEHGWIAAAFDVAEGLVIGAGRALTDQQSIVDRVEATASCGALAPGVRRISQRF
jgi:hypothetical protein